MINGKRSVTRKRLGTTGLEELRKSSILPPGHCQTSLWPDCNTRMGAGTSLVQGSTVPVL